MNDLKCYKMKMQKLLNDCCYFKYDQDTDIQQKPAKSTFSKVIQTQRLDNDNSNNNNNLLFILRKYPYVYDQ